MQSWFLLNNILEGSEWNWKR